MPVDNRTDARGGAPNDEAEDADLDPGIFREAMSRVGASVHIVTTAGPGGRIGVTVSAVTSVSDRPPLVLVCLNRTSRSHAVFAANPVFCVNTLSAADTALADLFAGKGGASMDERFSAAAWLTLATGAPALERARASLDCRVERIVEAGSHAVFFGRVEAVRVGGLTPPLFYVDRAYRS
ncbi:flavin reductase [Prosthecomicrobium pneumaticum]|uniref:Flavin reductase n=1 Tax=Prosthecomicrobium pneumaticum TaxID=81895 RepID=A0A7W9FPM0_9HYPH|nr:flavin reductase [Prosthecomicrobium pneumaticum]MBB5754499.1 flavin reductase [Prosthecomicrobium pneumaticum]